MVEGLELEELMNAPRMRMFRKLGEHLRTRVRGLAVLFLFGFVVGYPLAGEGIDWIINQSSLIPDDTQIVVLLIKFNGAIFLQCRHTQSSIHKLLFC